MTICSSGISGILKMIVIRVVTCKCLVNNAYQYLMHNNGVGLGTIYQDCC